MQKLTVSFRNSFMRMCFAFIIPVMIFTSCEEQVDDLWNTDDDGENVSPLVGDWYADSMQIFGECVLDSAYDLILVGELAADSRGKDSHTIFQRDFTFGGTLLLNNMDNSEFNLFLTRDLSYTSLLTRFSYSTRMNDGFTIKSDLNLYSNFEKDTSQAALAQDSNASITISYNW